MDKSLVPYGEAVRYGFDRFKENVGLFLKVALVFLCVAVLSNIGDLMFPEDPPAAITLISMVLGLAGWVVNQVMGIGALKILLKIYDGERPQVGDLFRYWRLFWKYFLTGLLQGAIFLFGLLLLIVPGIVWGLKYSMALNLVVDCGLSPMEALRKSGEMTKGVKGQLFVLYCLFGLLNIVGVLCLIVGLFVTGFTTSIAAVYVYRKLLEQTEGGAAETVTFENNDLGLAA